MREKEHKLQVACVEWFSYQHNNIKDLLFAIPNGGMRNKVVAKKLKMEGVRAGVPDLFLALPKVADIGPSPYCSGGLFIEMKVKPNRPTDSQNKMMDRLRSRGYVVAVCYSLDEFMEIVNEYVEK